MSGWKNDIQLFKCLDGKMIFNSLNVWMEKWHVCPNMSQKNANKLYNYPITVFDVSYCIYCKCAEFAT